MTADGSIKISTKIDQSGFNAGRKQIESGLNGITKSLKGVAAAAGLAFGVAAIVNFGKESVKAATELSNALIGLQSIMEGQGRSFSKAQEFIDSYVSDGLIPATQAITAYKNLALRGYDDSQIQSVLIALKDSAAFGRQASYSLGEAVATATEGLKNENSILVDNAGVTKNVAKMWDDYAKSIGTTTNNLTKQQKIQAEVLGIMEETKFQTGDAQKVANTYSGQILKLGFNFNNLKIAVGKALIPLAQAVLPSINAIIEGLTRLANRFAQISVMLLGKQAENQSNISKTAKSGAKEVTGLAKATEKAGAAAKKTLAGFDELNVLTQDMADGAGGLTQAIEEPTTQGEEKPKDPVPNLPVGKYYDFAKEIKPLAEAFDRLKESLSRLWNETGLKEVLGFLAESAIVAGIRILTGAVEILSGAFDVVTGLIQNIIGLLTGDMKLAVEGGQLFFSGLGRIIEGVFVALLGRDAVDAVKRFVVEFAVKAWNSITTAWSKAGAWFNTWVVQPIATFFTGLWEGVKTTFTTAWSFMTEAFKNYINGWIGMIEGFINFFVKAINTLIAGLNKISFDIPDWVPGIGGKSFGINIPMVPNVQIPRLATGAVIPPGAEFLAVLGDQKHGRNLEAPEGLIRQIIREELGDMGNELTVNMPVYLDSEKIYDGQKKVQARRGKSLISQPAY